MLGRTEFYIDGDWVKPAEAGVIDVLNPATEEVIGAVGRGTAKDVDSAVKAARGAFPLFAATDQEERIALIERIMAIFESRARDIASVISQEMGSPITFAYHQASAKSLRIALKSRSA